MKILSADQIREADKYTILHEPIASIDLMERAARACTDRIKELCKPGSKYVVVCGKGNNGGDGLAIARLLNMSGSKVDVYILEYVERDSTDFKKNLDHLRRSPLVTVHHVYNEESFEPGKEATIVIIDAILGTGTNKHTRGLIGDVMLKINKSNATVISIDVPSGLPADDIMPEDWPVVKATYTLTFQQPKLSFMFPEGGKYVGMLEVLDIGIHPGYIATLETPYSFLQEQDITPQLLPREVFSHKGSFGHSLIIAGSYGKMGAAVLSSRACLCSGAGLLTAHIPGCGYGIMQTSLPEAMCSIDGVQDHISALPPLDAYTSIGVGPGMGKDSQTAEIVKQLITSARCPLVIDADALNILSENKDWLGMLPANTILTPHPKEFDRLTGVHTNSRDRLKAAQALAEKHKVILVLKGAHTAIISPDGKACFNSTGNPALAKGGSGDVLTGIITALVSRGYTSHQAAILGVYLHGLSADLATASIHPESFLATDLIGGLSAAFRYIYAKA